MREIKFRGKCIPEFPHPVAKWVYGSFVSDKLILSPYKERNENRHFWYMVDPDTVGQYTGVKDINGKESYESDIIKFYDVRAHELVGVIKWNTLACRWYVDCSVRDCPYHVFDARYAFEILGNIHDSPELLEADHERD